MREILFRGKRIDDYVNDKSIDYAEKDDREWVYGDIIHRRYYKNTDVVVIRTEDSGFDNYSDYEVDPDTVGQYTGLTDKNGKKIFEGDVLNVHDQIPMFDGYDTDEIIYNGKVMYIDNQGMYVCEGNENGNALCALNLDECEVIGNIYDNPELLEVKE